MLSFDALFKKMDVRSILQIKLSASFADLRGIASFLAQAEVCAQLRRLRVLGFFCKAGNIAWPTICDKWVRSLALSIRVSLHSLKFFELPGINVTKRAFQDLGAAVAASRSLTHIELYTE